MSYSVAYFTSTGHPAGEPFSASLSLSAFRVPLVRSCRPSELSLPSKSARPAMPEDGSTNPEEARSSRFTVSCASSGVKEASAELMGPALPSSFKSPPPGRSAESVNGNCEVKDKSRAVMFTWSYTRGLVDELARPTDTRPSFTFSLLTERFAVEDSPDLASELDLSPPAEAALEPEVAPRLEKFHFPEAEWSRNISGRSSVRSVTWRVLEKISGITSTPTFSALARTNGSLLKAGSSAMERSSAETLPVRTERLRLPTLTWRPRVEVSSDSSRGRKLFTFTRKGSAITITNRTATTIPKIFSARFITVILPPWAVLFG